MTHLIDSDASTEGPQIVADGQVDKVEHRIPAAPSNEVLARVGNVVLLAARDGVRRGMRPEDIIRDIVSQHHIRMSLGDLRLLLASRPISASTKAEGTR
jgi:hypothetical protein